MQLRNCLILIIFVFSLSFLSFEHRNERVIVDKDKVSLLKLRNGILFGPNLRRILFCCRGNGNNLSTQDVVVFAVDNLEFNNNDESSGNSSNNNKESVPNQDPSNIPVPSSDPVVSSTSQQLGYSSSSEPIPIPVRSGSNKRSSSPSFPSPCSPSASASKLGFLGMRSRSVSSCVHHSSSSSSLSSSSTSSSSYSSLSSSSEYEVGETGEDKELKKRRYCGLKTDKKLRSRSPSPVFKFDEELT
ncbi:Signal peptide containing protein [Cryptosporidium tyzzeri]|nr:Signal peptide containing protein [Cryptosporidium tyzzeri]